MSYNQVVHTEECCTCHRSFVFDSNRNLWFPESDYEIYGFIWLHWDAATPAFKTDLGWCCSAECWNDKAKSEDELIVPGRLYLVRPA
jgi:hypothetical protein